MVILTQSQSMRRRSLVGKASPGAFLLYNNLIFAYNKNTHSYNEVYNMTNEQELTDILTYIVLPMTMDLIERWSFFQFSTPLKHLHESQFQELLDMITIDHVEVKQRLKAANIKVVENWKPGSSSLDYKIYVRRMEENVAFWKGHVKAEMSRALGKYVARLDKSKFIEKPEVVVAEKSSDRSLYVNF